MTTSEQINEIAAALAKAQAEMGGAKKDSENPHFRSRYADLASVREASAPLAKHGISVIQSPRGVFTNDGGFVVELETRFMHTSGQWISDTLTVPVSKVDAQGVGSATTYARRYALAAFAGIAPEDDDGEAAVGRGGSQPQVVRKAPTKPEGFDDWWQDFEAASDNGSAALKDAWEQSPVEFRQSAQQTKAAALRTLKTKAQQVAA